MTKKHTTEKQLIKLKVEWFKRGKESSKQELVDKIIEFLDLDNRYQHQSNTY